MRAQSGNGEMSSSDAAGADGELAIRISCQWHYVSKRSDRVRAASAEGIPPEPTPSATLARAATAPAAGAAAAGAAPEDEGQTLRDIGGVIEAMRTRMAAQDGYVEQMHACFAQLKHEIAPEYESYCARKIGTLQVTILSATDLPSSAGANLFNSSASNERAVFIALACSNC